MLQHANDAIDEMRRIDGFHNHDLRQQIADLLGVTLAERGRNPLESICGCAWRLRQTPLSE